jgi:3-oxo-5alpha-steroid 4-dehydrogenase
MVDAADTVFPVSAREIGSWDAEADVVVVGGGCAGTSAAVQAALDGAEVILIEAAGDLGGASAMSGGLIYMGGGTAIQKACGYDDTPEEMFKFLMAATAPEPDEAKLEVFCNDSVAHFDWLVERGVPFKASQYTGKMGEPPGDDGLMYSGGEDGYPWNEIAKPAPRAHIPQLENKVPRSRSGGWKLMQVLGDAATSTGVKTQFNSYVERLVVEDDGRVVGVVVRQFGERVHVHARSGVVLSSGGFVYNDWMLAQHAPILVGRPFDKLGTDGDDGRSIRMAQAVGATVKHMDTVEANFGLPSSLVRYSILTNIRGERFINEDSYMGRVGLAFLTTQNAQGFVVFDQDIYESVPDAELIRNDEQRRRIQPDWVCETIAELEDEMGLPRGCLESTIEVYNRYAEQGEDPLFHKRADCLKPLKPPFGAVDFRQGTLRVFTLGGLSTTPKGEVRNLDGDLIPGLFAAGRTASGVPAAGYQSGASLGDGTFFGRRAGSSAAQGAHA